MASVQKKNKVNNEESQVEFRNGWTIPVVCLVFAFAFTVVMIYMIALQSNRNKYYKEIDAEVETVSEYTDYDGEQHYEVIVRYVVEGEKYKQRLAYWDERLEIGDITKIKYDVRNPKIIKTTDTFVVLIIIEVVVSLILYVVSAFFLVRKIRIDNKTKKELKLTYTVDVKEDL